jgi:nickel transport protein
MPRLLLRPGSSIPSQKIQILTALTLTLLSLPVLSHDLWIERAGGAYTLYYGHKHSGHGGDKVIPYGPAFVTRAQCFDAQGQVNQEAKGGSPFRLEGECAALTIAASSGYWSKTPKGTQNVPKDEARQVVKSWLSLEWVKRLDAWSPALARPLTQGLELIALEDPLHLAKGDKLRLQLTLDRQPVAGATVTYDGEPRGLTDEEGRINLRVQHGDYQMISAGITRPRPSPQADEEVLATALVFELAPNP